MISKLPTSFFRLTKKTHVISLSTKKIFLAVLCMAGLGLQAQVSSYTPTGTGVGQTYTALTVGGGATGVFGTTVAATLDNAVSAAIPIGFNFNFNGKVYTTCYVSFNGFITFGSAPAASVANSATGDWTPISAPVNNYEGVIAAYAKDLKGAGLDVLRQMQGAAGNRTFTIQWTAYRSALASTPINMQIILHESDVANTTDPGVIEIKYNTSTSNIAQTAVQMGQIGLRGENNTDFNNKNYGSTTTAWPTASPVLPRGTANTQTVTTKFSTAWITAVTKLTWTPPTCFAPRKVTATPLSIASTTATLTWLAPEPVPSNGYQYLVSTTAPNNLNVTSPVAGTTATGTVGAGVLTTPISGLVPNTPYYIYVRSDCGGTSGWSAAGTFTTLCAPYAPLPYIQNFNASTPPTIPACNKVEKLTAEGPDLGEWVLRNGASALPGPYGFPDKRLQSTPGGGNDTNTTYFIEGIQLTAGVSYRLSYRYGASSEFPTTQQSMDVAYYTAPYSSAPRVVLADHPAIKAGPFTNVINFIPATTGVYYIGFYDYSEASTATLFLDDIEVDFTRCLTPTGLLVSGITSGSGTVTWTAPATAPASGYQYYIATSPFTAPTAATVPTGSVAAGTTSVTLGGLPPNTAFRVWVRSSCGGGDFSYWSPYVAFSTLTGPTAPSCVPSGSGFLQDPNGITNVTFGGVNNTTGIETNNYGDYSYLVGYGGQGTSLPISITYRTGFTYDTTIWVDWNNNGIFVAGEIVYTGNSAGTVPATLNGTIAIPSGASLGAHRMRIGGQDFGPVTDPCRSGSWQAYEDYTLWVTTPPPAVTLSTYSATVCQGATVNVNVTSTVGNYNTYTWTPNTGITGTAGSGYVFTPTVSTTYVLEAYNSTNFNRVTQSVTITVKPTPSALTVTPSSGTVCANATTGLALTASGGSISNIEIYKEDFNGSAPGWQQTNDTSNSPDPGDEALSAWSLYGDGYYFYGTYHSNDNSQFAMSESDSAGIGSITDTTLMSPSINLTGYTSATLQFYEFYNWFLSADEYGVVEITTDNGGSWTTLATRSNGDTGTATNFALTSFDLSTYAAANNTVRIRFRYHATWDFGWAIDNFSVTGSGPAPVTWSPNVRLFNDAGLVTAYTGDARTVVYAAPTTAQSYTATATFGGCPVTSNTVNIAVTPISGGTMPVASQSVCGGQPAAAIVVNTIVGTVLYWEYSDGPFPLATSFPSPVTIAGSAGLTTLSSALIGTVTATRRYRAVVSVGGCSNAYSPLHEITVPTTIWTGSWSNGAPTSATQAVFNSNYTASANLSACSIVVNGGATVTVNAGVTLTVQNGVTVAATGLMNFLNTSSLVQVNPSAVNTGDIHYLRTTTGMRAYDYTYWSSPVNAQILSKLSPLTLSDKYFWFNTTTYQWTAVAAPGITAMTPGRGYIIRAPQGFTATPQPFDGHFGYDGVTHGGGVPNNGTIVVPVGHNSAVNNLDCIGNPYPSAISANLFISDPANAAALGATGTTLYFWTHNTPITALDYTPNDYATYNYTGGTGTGTAAINSGVSTLPPNGNIAAGQGFMVKTAASGNVTFKNTMRLTGANTQFFRMANQEDPIESLERNRMWLELKNANGTAFKQILVGYIQNATNGIDSGFDGPLFEAGNPVGFYTIADNTKLTTQGRALPFNASDVIPVGYRNSVAGTYTIELPLVDGLFADQDVYLEDQLLNVVHNLKSGAYSFATEAGTFDTRFALRFVNTTLGTATPAFTENAVVVYKNGQTINIQTSNIIMKSVKIFDLRGRIIFANDNINNSKTEISDLDASQQVLLVQVTSTDNVTVTKKIVY